jgi:NAD(P)-dependent dehydrogenase (short-subunit alcohol dehydrogenase family)
MGSLKGENVVVIGGSRGVGRAIVEAALSEGANVLAVGRGAAALSKLAAETPGVKTLVADAARESTPEQVFAAMAPDVLVVCAGALAPAAPLQAQSWEAFSVNWEADVKASFLFCRAALQGALRPGARIVLISSGAALSGGPPFAGGYAAAKRAQLFMAGHAQKEADRLGLGLRFMALAPARIMPGTGVGDGGIEAYAAYAGVKASDIVAGMTAFQSPDDVGRAVVALATEPFDGCTFAVSENGLAPVS